MLLAFCGTPAMGSTPASPPPGAAPDPTSIDTATLPPGAHRDLVVRTCAMCHPIDIVVQKRRSQDEWDLLIARMVDHGARASEDEQQLIFEYLVKNFGRADTDTKAAPPPSPSN